MARQIRVEITGDASGLERTFQQAGRSAQRFERQVDTANRSAARSFDPLLAQVREMRSRADQLSTTLDRQAAAEREAAAARGRQLATVAALGGGFFALGRGLEGAGTALEVFQGHASETSQALGDAGQAIQSLITLDPAGFFRAVGASAQRTRDNLDNYNRSLDDVNQSERALQVAQAASAMGFEAQAQAIRDHVDELKAAQAATDALAFSQREYNTTVIDGTAYLVAFKGAHDAAMNPTGAPRVYGGTAATRPPLPTQGLFLTPSERRENELIGVEGMARIPLLTERIKALRAQLAEGVKLHSTYLRISNEIKTTEAEIAAIKTSQAARTKAEREAAEAEAERLRREAAERARRARDAALAAEQARQFRLIGLSPEGERPTPTVDNLRRQAAQIRARVDAGETLPAELLRRLPTVSKALTGGIKNMTEETRAAIAEFFRAIRDEWKRGDDNLKPFATAGLNVNRIVTGLGLTAAQARRLRARLAGSTTSGQMLAPGPGIGAFGMWVQRPIQTTVTLDGQVVGRSTKRYLSGDGIRSPMQKRGPHAGRW